MNSIPKTDIPGAEALAMRWEEPNDAVTPLRVDELPSFHVSRLAAQMRRFFTQEILTESGCSYAEWRVLGMLAELGPITTPDMVRISSMDKGQLSRAREQLLRRGLITQRPDPENRRRMILDATAQGRELNQDILAATRHWQVQLLQELPEDERLALARGLRHLEAAVNRRFPDQSC